MTSAIAGGVDLTGDGRPDIVGPQLGTTKTTRIYANIDGNRLSLRDRCNDGGTGAS